MISALLPLALFWILPPAQAKPKEIYLGISSASALPYVESVTQGGKVQVTGGILKNLAEALFKEMDISPVLVVLPKKRVAPDLISGDIGAVCYANESWYPGLEKKLFWSKEITTNTNLIVSTNKKPLKKIEDLHGEQVGTVVNFIHKNLEPYFEKNLIQRENGPDNESNLQKLIHGRIKYILLPSLEYTYHKKKYPQLVGHDLGIDTVDIKCAVSKKADLDLVRLNQVIDKLKKNGTIDKIFHL